MDFKTIYATKAEAYEAMIAPEDYQGNLLPALERIRSFAQQHVVEWGVGTGRLTCMLVPLVAHIHACDGSAHMLSVAERKLKAGGWQNWQLHHADNANLPLPSNSADIAIEGWSFAHARGWFPDSWQQKIGQMIAEMQRILKPGGTFILLETLGTGFEEPTPPNPQLAELYNWWTQTYQLNHTWIRTDYKFNSPEEGAHLTRFFFGDELADRILADQMIILPECTGIWWGAA
ncbi:class I SAM-dependent methyltransferase [Candidatus Leptofilum sp.]|uniref:class I SAM-dependent methyltransferase n=1 Tax=Candidatus Leptofilum sp. TaxID=3241576 RepID=UPI003B5B0A1B